MPKDPYRIALLLPIDSEYSGRLTEGASRYASEHPEIRIVEFPFMHGRSPLPEGALPFDAALILPGPSEKWMDRLLGEGIPVVTANGEVLDDRLPMVGFSGDKIRDLAFDFLAGLGRPRMAYIGVETSKSRLSAENEARFVERASKRGVESSRFEIRGVIGMENRPTGLPEAEAARLGKFLRDLPKPAAAWCGNDYAARFVCDCAAAAGVLVPEELAVLGMGDFSISRCSSPGISTIPLPGQIIGHRALEVIHGLLDGTAKPRKVVEMPPPPVIERESTGSVRVDDERFRRIREWIEEHACDGITVNEVVAMTPMSQFTLTKHFERLFGRTPGEEIRRVRVARAMHYLRSTDFPVERIARLCGFPGTSNFSKFFRKQTGRSPSQYRKGVRK